ncbi:uncharacterized protein LOC133525818 [Cydia pomonella]|uniref:uncharacterized protein LOC133525818 n=1 Tax=Cydia pomonella TaxID=82600 RepID=UPI002ADDABF4|nr:uncharacterized protein LOC133525818 [Cydia pomonella]
MRALIDPGAQMCLISENAAQQLGLPRQQEKGVITGVGLRDSKCKGMLYVTCLSSDEKYSFNTEAFIMKDLTRKLPNFTFPKARWDILDTLPLADYNYNVNNSIDILLGAEIYATILMHGMYKHGNLSLVVQETHLGWIICGRVPQSFQCNLVLNNIEDIQKFWEIEDIPAQTLNTNEEDECVKYYKETTTRLADGRYQVRIPLKKAGLQKLGHSKSKAVAQFRQLEYKFNKNKHIAQQYKSFIHEYLSMGHMTISPTKQWRNAREAREASECYLPHHCVLRESSTSALRVVFNGSAKTSTGVSLNDIMHKGPNLQKDLLSLILKWRQHRVAYIADVEKMFRQIWVHQEDQSLQKIIWRDSPNEMLQEYQLTTVTYGQKAAPFLAMMTLKQLAHDERSNYPEAAKALEESFYMDDLLHGSHSVSSAKQLQHELQKLLQSGGFYLRKWMSNYQELARTDNQDTSDENNYYFKEMESRKTLGLQWDPS